VQVIDLSIKKMVNLFQLKNPHNLKKQVRKKFRQDTSRCTYNLQLTKSLEIIKDK